MTYPKLRDGVLHLRVPEEDKARWGAAAGAAGCSLATWVIEALNGWARQAEVAAAPVVPATGRVERPPVVLATTDEGDLAAVIEGRAEAAFDGDVLGTFGGGSGVQPGSSDREPPAVVARGPREVLTPEDVARRQATFRRVIGTKAPNSSSK